MAQTTYEKIKKFDNSLFKKIIKLTQKRNNKRKLRDLFEKHFKFLQKPPLNIQEIDKTPVLNSIKDFLNLENTDEIMDLIEKNTNKIAKIPQLNNHKETKKHWFSNEIKHWLVVNMNVQLSYYNDIYSYLIKHFKNDSTIKMLDYGCGAASLSISLYNNLDIESLDLYELDNEIANYLRFIQNEKISYHNVLTEELNENNYDLILCLDVLEHIPNSSEVLKKLHRSLKKGGILALSAPFELDSTSHIPESADDFFNNDGYKFLNKNFVEIFDRRSTLLVSSIYKKK